MRFLKYFDPRRIMDEMNGPRLCIGNAKTNFSFNSTCWEKRHNRAFFSRGKWIYSPSPLPEGIDRSQYVKKLDYDINLPWKANISVTAIGTALVPVFEAGLAVSGTDACEFRWMRVEVNGTRPFWPQKRIRYWGKTEISSR